MRLWHKDLLDVLPREQLVSQWRECCAIAKTLSEKKIPKHRLVSKVAKYDSLHFICYSSLVAYEMLRRGYKCNERNFKRYMDLWSTKIKRPQIFPDWHNERYLIQNYYNLQEKYDCGMLSEEEWKKVHNKCKILIEEHSIGKDILEGWE